MSSLADPSDSDFSSFRLDRPELIRERMRRCSEVSVEAAIDYQESRDPSLIQPIVLGVLARFIDSNLRPQLASGGGELRLCEDLGVDSLLMIEIVVLLEDIFEITIENEELRGVETLADVRRLCLRLAELPETMSSPRCAGSSI